MSKMFNYEADQIHDMVHPNLLTDTTHYVAECKDIILTEATPNYPKLIDYESEWLYFYENIYGGGGDPVDLEYQTLEFEQHAIVHNAIPFSYKSAILKGNTEIIVGKNLFNGNLENGAYSHLTGVKEEKASVLRSVDFIKVEPSSTICCSNNGIARGTHIFEYDENKEFLKFNNGITKLNLLPSTKYITFYGENRNRDKMQIEYGEEPTDYEEYKQTMKSVKMPVLTTSNEDGTKTNILSTPSDLELRGIGNVQDTLDLMTGELTQRIEEMIVDDFNDWWNATNTDGSLRTGKNFTEIKSSSKLSCDLLPTIDYNSGVGGQKGCAIYGQQIIIFTEHTNKEELKRWVQQNPLTIQYELATESIKTVDLNGILNKPYEGTNHYYTSSDTIPPRCTLSIPVESTGAKTLNDISQED